MTLRLFRQGLWQRGTLVTVAILAQSTSWAVAVTQAFFHFGNEGSFGMFLFVFRWQHKQGEHHATYEDIVLHGRRFESRNGSSESLVSWIASIGRCWLGDEEEARKGASAAKRSREL